MSNAVPKYRIYPTLLNAYVRYLASEAAAEDYSNVDAEGNYRLTPDQIWEQREEELLNCINRVRTATTEAQAKGTAFNEVVDCLVNSRKSIREDTQIESVTQSDGTKAVKATTDGFTFLFDMESCKRAAAYFAGCIPQYYCKADLQTKYGVVELYGYADELRRDKVYDIKTTGRYTFPKYEDGTQKDLYPYCLVESGEMQSCSSFEYTVYVPSGGTGRTPLITMTEYKEEYTYNHEKATERLRLLCEGLIEWIEAHRSLITDKKIFGGENE